MGLLFWLQEALEQPLEAIVEHGLKHTGLDVDKKPRRKDTAKGFGFGQELWHPHEKKPRRMSRNPN